MAENSKKKDRLKEITDGIEQGIKELFDSDRYAQYLRTMSRFHRYSVNNTMLIHMQRPDATLVAGFNKWRDQFGRHVQKGERGIQIIAPTPLKKKIETQKIDPDTQKPVLNADGTVAMEEKEVRIPLYKVVTVFDVSQTEGRPLPALASDLHGDVKQYEVFMEALRRASPVPMTVQPMQEDMDGYFSYDSQSIAIRQGMSEVQTVAAAVHEITHAKLHNYEQAQLAAAAGTAEAKRPKPKDRQTEEVEAESVSYAVCQYYGIQTGENSFGYIASWSKGKELPELRASLELINKTANGLITDIDRHFAEICKERGIDLTQPEATSPHNAAKLEQEAVQTSPELADQEQEALYLLDDAVYLHIQATDTGFDYTFYDKATLRQTDGGQLDYQDPARVPEQPFASARSMICAMEGKASAKVETVSLDVLESLQEAQFEPPPNPRVAELIEHFSREDADSLPEPPEQTLDEYPMPDPALTVADLEQCGYLDGDLLPISKGRAYELMEQDLTIYTILPDAGAEMAFDAEDLDAHSGVFAVTREEWQAAPAFQEAVADRLNHQPEREAAFLTASKDAFAIYQLKGGEALRDIRFEPLSWLESKGRKVERENYDLVYTGSFTAYGGVRDRLEELWDRFNNDHPADYQRPSLSVSDIVAIKQDGKVLCHYCDSFDFVELPGFFSGQNMLRAAEDSLEQNDNQLDGLINNLPSQPTVAELERQASTGHPISLMDLAAAVHREQREKKPSVVEQLKKTPPQERKKKAPSKGAEREI